MSEIVLKPLGREDKFAYNAALRQAQQKVFLAKETDSDNVLVPYGRTLLDFIANATSAGFKDGDADKLLIAYTVAAAFISRVEPQAEKEVASRMNAFLADGLDSKKDDIFSTHFRQIFKRSNFITPLDARNNTIEALHTKPAYVPDSLVQTSDSFARLLDKRFMGTLTQHVCILYTRDDMTHMQKANGAARMLSL